MRTAKQIGIGTPTDFTDYIHDVDQNGRAERALRELELPVFLKASREAGRNIISKVDSYEEFWSKYDHLRRETIDGLVLVQEYIDGDPATFGYGFLFLDGKAVLAFGHEEIRSVPRLGGSGTRLRVFENEELKQASEKLLRELGYEGVALVEYKKRSDGSFVVMEVNPKFWASYSLASKCNYHFAAKLVGTCLDIPVKTYDKRNRCEMVFPLREAIYCAKNWGNDGELLVKSAAAMLWPPARWDMSMKETWWSLPPLSYVVKRTVSGLSKEVD